MVVCCHFIVDYISDNLFNDKPNEIALINVSSSFKVYLNQPAFSHLDGKLILLYSGVLQSKVNLIPLTSNLKRY